MKVAIVVPSLIRYDAVGNDVISMYKILLDNKYDVHIYAQNWDKQFEKNFRIFSIEAIGRILDDPECLMIYHHAVYAEFLPQILYGKCKKVLRYHNITPYHFFENYDDFSVKICKLGREQIKKVVDKFDFFLSCSEFNNVELINYGVDLQKTYILPPFHEIESWQAIPDDDKDINIFSQKINILGVGRLVPHKNWELTILSFADYFYFYNKNSHLHIVGRPGSIKYYEKLKRLIEDLNLYDHVTLYTGGIPASQLKALYKKCHLFMLTSLHEGFCVPLVEAMYFKKPIIALNTTAIPYTLDKSGILISENDPLFFSAAISIVMNNTFFYDYLSQVSFARYKSFSFDCLRKKFLYFIGKVSNTTSLL